MRKLVLVLFILMIPVAMVGAGQRDGLTITSDCEGFTIVSGGVFLDRDNTGDNREAVQIVAVDAAGNTVYEADEYVFAVGGALYFAEDTFFEWTAAPELNPITVSVVSLAGNGFEEQTIYAINGACIGLPTDTDDFGVVDGDPSPSTEINQLPPEADNPINIASDQPGYLIVNTPRLNIRSGDGPGYTIVGRLDGGTELVVLGRNEDRSWWFVQAGDIRGWVIDELVYVRGDLRGVPVVPVQGEILPPRFVTYSRTPLYPGDSLSGLPLCEIPGNLEYVIIGQSAGNAVPLGTLVTGSSAGRTSIKIVAACNGEAVEGWVSAATGAVRNSGDFAIPVLDD